MEFCDSVCPSVAISQIGCFLEFLGECGDFKGLVVYVCALDRDLGLGLRIFRTGIVVCFDNFSGYHLLF